MKLDLKNTRLKKLVLRCCSRVPAATISKVLTIKDFPDVPSDKPCGAGYTFYPKKFLRYPEKLNYRAAILLFEPHFEGISDCAAIGIIAHEFGHVSQGPRYHTSATEEGKKRETLAVEIEADGAARSWGLDSEILAMRKELGVPLV